MLLLETHLEGVLPINLGEVIGNLNRGTHFVRRQECITTQRLQAIDAESRESAIFLLLRNTEDAKAARKIGQVVGFGYVARGMQVIQANTRNVDCSRRKCVIPHQGAMLRARSL